MPVLSYQFEYGVEFLLDYVILSSNSAVVKFAFRLLGVHEISTGYTLGSMLLTIFLIWKYLDLCQKNNSCYFFLLLLLTSVVFRFAFSNIGFYHILLNEKENLIICKQEISGIFDNICFLNIYLTFRRKKRREKQLFFSKYLKMVPSSSGLAARSKYREIVNKKVNACENRK